jgi:UDP-N-acetylglucosamine--N-acetylmuramyl-(pentapeptide) pyrophosphoryl-undecaprenol N-acetylglucosamine transferase
MAESPLLFLMAGGGTGGHVIPAIAVARELVKRGHDVTFVGTDRGVEARLVPAAGFKLERIQVGGIKNLGLATKLYSAWRLLAETFHQLNNFSTLQPAAVFSMGGYVAGPPVLAALIKRVPVVVMEPNAVPGVTNRWIAARVARALIAFEETRRFFPPSRTELTGLPVREEFFRIAPKPQAETFTVLITGGSQGSQRLNNAARQAWPLFRDSRLPIRFLHQTGLAMHEELEVEFAETGLKGEIRAFIADMPAAFAEADLVVCRSGAGAVSELAAAGKPSILIPFPFAADDHQLKNAQSFEKAGAAILSLDKDWTAKSFFDSVSALCQDRARLQTMGNTARTLAHSGAAGRAAEILIDIAGKRRNNKD